MSRPDPLRLYVDRAREAYEVASYPDISLIHDLSMRWGVDPERYAEPTDSPLTSHRKALLQHGIDVKRIIAQFLDTLSETRARNLKEWLQPGGNTRNYSHWQQTELNYDRKRLLLRVTEYKMAARKG